MAARVLVVAGRSFSSISEAAHHFSIPVGALVQRLAAGWSIEEAVGLLPRAPREPRGIRVTIGGVTYPTITAAADALGVSLKRINGRIAKGMAPQQAIEDALAAVRLLEERKAAEADRKQKQEKLDAALKDAPRVVDGKVYVITNVFNGKQYVGLTSRSLQWRLSRHRISARKGLGEPGGLLEAIREFGIAAFRMELLESVDTDDAMAAAEKSWIEKLNTLAPAGYNKNTGGVLGGNGKTYVLEGKTDLGLTEIADAYGIVEITIHKRMQSGRWTLEQACGLEPPPRHPLKRKTDKKLAVAGLEFPTITAACRHFGVDKRVFDIRTRKLGWTVEEALGIAKRDEPVFVVADKQFASFTAACKAFGLPLKCVESRLRLGWSVGEAFEVTPRMQSAKKPRVKSTAPQPITLGKTNFRSLEAAAQHFGIKAPTVRYRLGAGWSKEEAFELTARARKAAS